MFPEYHYDDNILKWGNAYTTGNGRETICYGAKVNCPLDSLSVLAFSTTKYHQLKTLAACQHRLCWSTVYPIPFLVNQTMLCCFIVLNDTFCTQTGQNKPKSCWSWYNVVFPNIAFSHCNVCKDTYAEDDSVCVKSLKTLQSMLIIRRWGCYRSRLA